MEKIDHVILLDIDGVLISTFPMWKSDDLDKDGYSKFNQVWTANLKDLLAVNPNTQLVISSSRRIGKSIERLEEIFAFRGIKHKIIDKVPDPEETHLSRKIELTQYIEKQQLKNFLIIDDDISLLDLPEAYAAQLVLTKYREGFNKERLKKAFSIINKWSR